MTASCRNADSMCFDRDSSPPIPAIAGAAVSHDDLVLTAADGNELAAFAAEPDEAARVGIVILPDVRGLYRFYEELALRFGERGCRAIAFDYFGRTAGTAKRADDFEYRTHVEQTTPEGVQADVAACVAYLRERGTPSILTVGFCFGGRHSWAAAGAGHGLKGAIGFYGRSAPILDIVPRFEAPILALQAGADAAIPHEENVEFERVLREHGKQYDLIEYDGAPHSFFDRKQEEFAEASDDAWRRVLDFVGRNA